MNTYIVGDNHKEIILLLCGGYFLIVLYVGLLVSSLSDMIKKGHREVLSLRKQLENNSLFKIKVVSDDTLDTTKQD